MSVESCNEQAVTGYASLITHSLMPFTPSWHVGQQRVIKLMLFLVSVMLQIEQITPDNE